MNAKAESTIRWAVAAASLPQAFAESLLVDAPWLDGVEELNEELILELLANVVSLHGIDSKDLDRFGRMYNQGVRTAANPHAAIQSQAYSEFQGTLASYGQEGVMECDDFWLISDSFSTRRPAIVLQHHFSPPPNALAALQAVLERYAATFDSLRLTDEEGNELHVLGPK